MSLALMQCRVEGRTAAKNGAGQHSNPYGGRDADDRARAWDDGYRAHLREINEMEDEEIEGHR